MKNVQFCILNLCTILWEKQSLGDLRLWEASNEV